MSCRASGSCESCCRQCNDRNNCTNNGISSVRLSANRQSIIKRTSLWSGLKELYYLKNLHHPNIVTVKVVQFYWDDYDNNGSVTDYVDSASKATQVKSIYLEITQPVYLPLSVYIKSFKVDQQATRRVVYHDILGVLEYLAARGINHNDIKPDNIVIDLVDRDRPQAILIDFGSATIRSTQAWSDCAEIAVSAITAAPELLSYGPIKQLPQASSDLFSLAATLIILNRGSFYPDYDHGPLTVQQRHNFVLEQGYLNLLVDDPLADQIRPWLAYQASDRILPWLNSTKASSTESQADSLVSQSVALVTKCLTITGSDLSQWNQIKAAYYLTAAYLLAVNVLSRSDLGHSDTWLAADFLAALEDLAVTLNYDVVTDLVPLRTQP